MTSFAARVLPALILVVLLQLLRSSQGEPLKRVPQGFIGLRGKKYSDDAGPLDKRRQGFVGVKGKKDADYYYPLGYDPYSFLKRAPTGFLGMRGKKYLPYELDEISAEYVPKRGSILGQIDYSSGETIDSDFSILSDMIQRLAERSNDDENSVNYGEPDLHNRAEPDLQTMAESSGSEQGTASDLAKRAAQMSQFFGVRGKKSGSTSYPGSKRPFDLSFRGKFVAVRGKKSAEMGSEEKRHIGHGFFGVRGKKDDFSMLTQEEVD